LPDLANLIQQEIATSGPITFARFMDLALYHPQWGYYTSPGTKIGRAGDFYTAPTVNPLFGAMLARQLDQLWVSCGRPAQWIVAEYGPGTGILARDIVTALRKDHSEVYAALDYYLIEISNELIKVQKQTISTSEFIESHKFHWVDSLSAINLGYIENGCVLANELVDALPVHLVQQGTDELQELYVGLNDAEVNNFFTLIPGHLSNEELADYFSMQNVHLEEGQRAEVNLQAREWLADVSSHLKQGYLVTIDYGATAEELYAPFRFDGTLRCFHKHQLVDNPLINLGSQDITAHVNFSVLITWGEQLGLRKKEIVAQPQFLLNQGILDILRQQPDYTQSPDSFIITSAIKQLVLPGGMGDIFKVLVQEKDVL